MGQRLRRQGGVRHGDDRTRRPEGSAGSGDGCFGWIRQAGARFTIEHNMNISYDLHGRTRASDQLKFVAL